MQEQGSNARNTLDNAIRMTDIQARGFDAQTARALDARRLGLEEQAKGFDIRAAQRHENLVQKYEAAKTTEERSAIAQQIRDLQGKSERGEWDLQVTPAAKNPDGSTSEGSIYRYNRHTGQVERVDTGAPAPIAAPKAGEVRNGYRFKGGNPNDQANWTKV